MATAATAIYRATRAALFKAGIDYLDDAIMVALVGSGYAPSLDHIAWADVAAHEITGTGYTAGGQALANKSVTVAGDTTVFDAADTTWANLTATFRYAVLYAAVARDGVTNPLLGYILIDDTPADTVVAGVDWSIIWSADGVFSMD